MEVWDYVFEEPVVAAWTRFVIDRWHHGEMGGVRYIISSSVEAHQVSAPKVNGQVQSKGAV